MSVLKTLQTRAQYAFRERAKYHQLLIAENRQPLCDDLVPRVQHLRTCSPAGCRKLKWSGASVSGMAPTLDQTFGGKPVDPANSATVGEANTDCERSD